MDRALDLEALTAAVGEGHPRLPDPVTLSKLLAKTEISLFIRQADIDERVLDTGWYLQAVATARPDLNLYDPVRQRQAHQVSGHIFDLALQSIELSTTERMRYTFAAQVGYLGGQLTPNAAALARRAPLPTDPYDWSEPGLMSLEVGILVLALDRPALFQLLRTRLNQLQSNPGDLVETPFAAVNGVIRGSLALTNYLTYGTETKLNEARRFFSAALSSEAAESDVDSRWVAAHLLRISGDLAATSVWAVLPPDMHGAARATTLGDPPVLSLWPPQLSFLAGTDPESSPFTPDARRLVLSFPTSAGKTLLAQILILAHVADSSAAGVCVVAPTHSLCRELHRSLDRRLRILGDQIYREGPLGFDQPKPAAARVTVMTPEKLAALLRANPAELLDNFAMFVIDEAHLVADGSRGWRLEATLSFLHHLTRSTDHRIVLLSAALGNQIHVIQWMTPDGNDVIQRHADWRGPRRLNVIYSNKANWEEAVDVPAEGRILPRQKVPLRGLVHLRTGDITVPGEFTEPVGTLVRRRTKKGEWVTDKATTTQRDRLVPLVNHVAVSGPVLIIQPTRPDAQRLAAAIAATIDEDGTPFPLVDLTRTRLTETHPLTKMVSKGVAFHHAALPVDIQAEIEDAVRSGQIRILVATSTLIEGINLPFKTVIVGRRGYPDAAGDFVELINAPGLLNAIGRAGRAGRETEGWMILAEQSAPYSDEMFKPLQRTGDELDIRSTLTTEVALAGLIAFETAARSAEDAVFRHYNPATDGFLSFVWFVAQALEDLNGNTASIGDIVAAIHSTLAWQQFDSEQREQLVRVVQESLDAFDEQPIEQRTRWARSGTSLGTARTLDNIAERLLAKLDGGIDLDSIAALIDLVLGAHTLQELLDLPENNRRGFKPYRNAPKDALLAVDLRNLLLDWVSGTELQELADRYLAKISDEGYRSEQLAEFSATVFEHHLPWTVGIVVQWVNARLEATDLEWRLPEHLPAAIHYGVSTLTALNLMVGGVRSRRLANIVAVHFPDREEGNNEQQLREWLADQSITDWRELFQASPTEIADLLSFARAPGTRIISSILEGNVLQLQITSEIRLSATIKATIVPEPDTPEPALIQVITSKGIAGTIRSSDHNDVTLLTSMGIPLNIEAAPSREGSVVSISLAPEPDLA